MNEYLTILQQITTDPLSFFHFFGYVGLGAILFAETGLFCFFLPGDSLLITLGLISSNGDIDLNYLIPTLIFSTLLGDCFSYFLGRKYALTVKKNIGLLFLEEKHIEKAHLFYEKHGGKTIFISKFLAFIRTFAPFVAGTSKMPLFRFFLIDFLGATFWVISIVGGTHFLGQYVHFNIREYFHYFIFLLIGLALLPFLLKFIKKK